MQCTGASIRQANIGFSEDYQAEIQVGPYAQWLRQLDSGPTQAERVLVHTEMMEHADERRFAVCQAGFDMSRFELDHSRRIELAIDHLQSYFFANPSYEADSAEDHDHKALIGLAQTRPEQKYVDCSQFASHSTTRERTPMLVALHSMLQRANSAKSKQAAVFAEDAIMADVTDSDEEDKKLQEKQLEALVATAVRNSLRKPTVGVRQYKIIRIRRGHARPAVKHAGRVDVDDHVL